MPFEGVFPIYKTKLKVGTKGLASTSAEMATVADLTSFGLTIDGVVQTWTPMTTDGWQRALQTGKAYAITFQGKRNVGDPGNDYIADIAWKDGLDCSTNFEIEWPDGSTLTGNCVINITNPGGGESTDVTPLEFELQGDGKPEYTPAVP